MNLENTVSRILKREVSIIEAKDFASTQFGVLTAWLKENLLKPKEYRVYILDVDIEADFDINAYEVENWVLYQERHEKLTTEAEKFISLCEEQGEVYSLNGFQNALNIEDININNNFIFITNCY